MASAEDRYTDELEQILEQIDDLEEEAAQQALEVVDDTRRRLIEVLLGLSAIDVLLSYQVLPQVDALLRRLVQRYQSEVGRLYFEAWDLGMALIDEPLAAAGGKWLVATLLGGSLPFTDLMQDLVPQLNRQVTQPLRREITSAVQWLALGRHTPAEASHTIAELLRTTPDADGIRHGIAAEASGLARDAVLSTVSLATQAHMQALQRQVQQTDPEATPMKTWITRLDARVRPTHRAAHGQTVPIDADFVIGGYRGRYPQDRRLPVKETARCRCRAVIDVQSITSVIEAKNP